MIKYAKIAALMFMLILTSGCSQKFNDINATLNEAFFGMPDVPITKESVQQIPYASMEVRINDGPAIMMILAFADKHTDSANLRLKWLSEDGAMLVTENGRIVKTLNLFETNLTNIAFSENNEISIGESSTTSAKYDWQPGYFYSEDVIIESNTKGNVFIESYIWSKQAQLVEEIISFESANTSHKNFYYLDTANNVVKSSQWLVPNSLQVKYEILKPYHE